MQRRPLQLTVEQLRGAANAAQRILDFMRKVADQIAMRLALFEQPRFALDAQLAVDLAKFKQRHDFLRNADFGRSNRAGEIQAWPAIRHDFQLMLGIGTGIGAGVVDRRLQHRIFTEQLRQRQAGGAGI